MWNDTSRATVSSTLKSSILKGTLLVNYFKGPFKSGQYAYDLQEGAKKYLRDTGGSELSSLSEEWSMDMGFDSTDAHRSCIPGPARDMQPFAYCL